MNWQYSCAVCGALRFVEVDPIGIEMFKHIRLCCPKCSGEPSNVVPMKEPPPMPNENKWIPTEFQNTDESLLPPVWGTMRYWLPNDGGIYIYGPTRRCKSRMAYMIIARALARGEVVETYDSRTLRGKVEQCISAGTLWAWYETLKNVDVVLIDDLGKFDGNGRRIEEEVFNLVKLRCEAKKPMIITSNDSPKLLGNRFSEEFRAPLIARLEEQCRVVSVYSDEEQAALTAEADMFTRSADL